MTDAKHASVLLAGRYAQSRRGQNTLCHFIDDTDTLLNDIAWAACGRMYRASLMREVSSNAQPRCRRCQAALRARTAPPKGDLRVPDET